MKKFITILKKSINNNPLIFLSRYVWHFSKNNRLKVVLYLTLSIIANLINFLQPLLVAFLLNTVQNEGVNKENLLFVLGLISLFVVLTIGFWIFHGPSRAIERKNAFFVRTNYKKYLVDGVLELPSSWHTDHHSGDVIDKIEKGTDSLYRFSGSTFEIIDPIIKLISSYLALIYFNMHSAYIVSFIFFISIALVIKFDKRLGLQYKEIYLAENRASQKVFDVISNITTVIILRIEKLVSNEIVKKLLHPFGLYKENVTLNEIKWFLVSLFVSSTMFLVLGSYIVLTVLSGGTVLLGTLYALYGYTDRIGSVFYRFASKYSDIVQQKSAVENAEELSKDFITKNNVKKINLPNNWKQIHINNLSFSYHDSKQNLHLNEVSFSFKKGEKIALIGASGSGKTTFLKLIRALYLPKHVEVFVDKVLVDSLESISNDMTLIPQEPEIFATTIRENITVGVQHNLNYLKKFTRMAQFLNVVFRLPKKWESSVVEKGVNLSGGEKQRLALARGLMASDEKDILLMDEPTSSVDTYNELRIYENIFKNFKNKTIISTVHRLHLLPMFDTLYLFDKGRIIARGNLNELLKTSPHFKRLWLRYKMKKQQMNVQISKNL